MKSCPFCEIVADRAPAWKVYEDAQVLAFFDKGAVAEYHTLVIPKRHVPSIFEAEDEEMRTIASAVRTTCKKYWDGLGIGAFQIISSNGAAAQQEVPHLHFHIVPRSENDHQDVKWVHDPAIPQRFDRLLQRYRALLDTT